MDKFELIKERRLIFKRLREINSLLNIDENYNLSIEEIAIKVKELTGIDVKNIGRKGNKEVKNAKQLFWRAGFNQSISGASLSKYTGDKSRFAAGMGRIYHKNKCEYDPLLRNQWNELKKIIKEI